MTLPKDPIKREEWRQKQVESHKGKKRPNISLAKKDKKNPKLAIYMKKAYAEGKWRPPKYWKDKKNPKQSIFMKENFPTNKEYFGIGHRSVNKGVPMSEEQKQKIRIANTGRIITDEWRKNISKGRIHQVFPKIDSSIEIAVQEALTSQNIVFTTHKLIFGQPDIFIEPNICIFADGCYWHACPQHYPDRTKLDAIQNKNVIRDTLVNQFFSIRPQYKVLRFWEHEINGDIENVMNRITEFLEVVNNE